MNTHSPFLTTIGRALRRSVFATAVGATLASGAALAGDLKILHINDHHSHLKPDARMSLKLDGQSTRVRSGGMAAAA